MHLLVSGPVRSIGGPLLSRPKAVQIPHPPRAAFAKCSPDDALHLAGHHVDGTEYPAVRSGICRGSEGRTRAHAKLSSLSDMLIAVRHAKSAITLTADRLMAAFGFDRPASRFRVFRRSVPVAEVGIVPMGIL